MTNNLNFAKKYLEIGIAIMSIFHVKGTMAGTVTYDGEEHTYEDGLKWLMRAERIMKLRKPRSKSQE